MPEVQARRYLGGRIGTLSVLAPVGSFAGRGELRILRVRAHNELGDEARLEVTCGYEAYEALK